MTGQVNALDPSVRARMKSHGKCLIPGKILEIKDHRGGAGYPGLVDASTLNSSLVVGELFEIGQDDRRAADVLRALDAHEEFIPDNPADSAYLRRFVGVFVGSDRNTKKGAWVYVYNKSTAGVPVIESGDWSSFVKK